MGFGTAECDDDRSLSSIRVIGIGASVGGPMAIAAILHHLPADFPACIALVLHVSPGFTGALATFLRNRTGLRVEVVGAEASARPGSILIADDDRHLVAADGETFRAEAAPPVEGHRPSVTKLFSTLAETYGASAVGVLLTGVGEDGASGLKSMQARGAVTIAQDQTTSTAYGMPKAAIESGAADLVLAISEIPSALMRLVGCGAPSDPT
jgi:two-component system chemotaxis response regulator CheB